MTATTCRVAPLSAARRTPSVWPFGIDDHRDHGGGRVKGSWGCVADLRSYGSRMRGSGTEGTTGVGLGNIGTHPQGAVPPPACASSIRGHRTVGREFQRPLRPANECQLPRNDAHYIQLDPRWGARVDVATARVFYRDPASNASYWSFPLNCQLENGWMRELTIDNVECFRGTSRDYELWHHGTHDQQKSDRTR